MRFAGVQYATNFAHRPRLRHLPPADDRRPRAAGFGGRRVHRQRPARGALGPAGPVRDGKPAGGHRRRRGAAAGHRPARPRAAGDPVLLCQLAPAEAGPARFRLPGSVRRRDYGNESFDYGEALASATHRYGFSDRLTGEAHGELQPDQQSVRRWAAPICSASWGVVSSGIGARPQRRSGPGVLGELGLRVRRPQLQLRRADPLHQRRLSRGRRRRGRRRGSTSSASASTSATAAVSARCSCIRDGRDTENATTLAATYSVPLGPGRSDATRGPAVPSRTVSWRVTAVYTLPLGAPLGHPPRSLKRGGDYAARACFRQTRGASDLGLDYRIAAEAGTARRAASRRGMSYQIGARGRRLDGRAVRRRQRACGPASTAAWP